MSPSQVDLTDASTTVSISIDLIPFASPTVQQLITALDTEVEELYPDHADFPFESTAGGDWLNPHPAHHAHLQPNLDSDLTGTGTITAREFVVGGGNASQVEATWQNEHPDDMQQAEDKAELFFFVARARARRTPAHGEVTGDTDTDGEGEGGGREQELSTVGCVALRLLPHFPYHRAPPTQITDPISLSSSSSLGPAPSTSVRTAEIKRMYVVPSYRGRRLTPAQHQPVEPQTIITTPSNTATAMTLATHLLHHAEGFARDHLQVERLVLETGMRQYAANKLYVREGWKRRAEFGDYVGAGEDVGGLSRCWEKDL